MRNRIKKTFGEKLIKGLLTVQVIVLVLFYIGMGALGYIATDKIMDNGGIENTIVLVGKSVKRIGERISEDEDTKPVPAD